MGAKRSLATAAKAVKKAHKGGVELKAAASSKNAHGSKLKRLKDLKGKEKLAAKKPSSKKKRQLTIAQRHKIIVAHMESSRRLAWSFLNKWRVRLEEDEVVSIAGTALCEAAHRFDPNYNVSFGTFFFYHLRGLLLKEISQRIQDSRMYHRTEDANQIEQTPLTLTTGQNQAAPLLDGDTPEHIVERNERSKICWEACAKLDALEQDVIVRFFVNEQSVVDIAKELGYCRCHISRVKSRALAILANHLRPLNPDVEVNTEHNYDEEGSSSDLMPSKPRSYRGGRGRRKSGTVIRPIFNKKAKSEPESLAS